MSHRYAKCNTAPMMIIPRTTKIEFFPLVDFFDCLLIADVALIMRKLNKNELDIFQ